MESIVFLCSIKRISNDETKYSGLFHEFGLFRICIGPNKFFSLRDAYGKEKKTALQR